jgi:PTS system glucose-specific IIA component
MPDFWVAPCDFVESLIAVDPLCRKRRPLPKLCGSLEETSNPRLSFRHARIVGAHEQRRSIVSTTPVLAPVAGRAVPLADVPDPVFSQGMVGYGAAVDPPRGVIEAVAPVSGKLLKLMPHAYIIMTPDNVGVLVHLGLDTVALKGEGFTTHVNQGDDVVAGEVIVTYDVPSVEAKGLNPIVPVVVMDEREPGNVVPADAVISGADIASGASLFTANK